MPSPDYGWEAFRVQQDSQSQLPPTIASSTTVAPTTFVSFISGTTGINTVTPPLLGPHVLCFIYTNATPAAYGTTGNVKTTTAATQWVPQFLVYDPSSAKYYLK